MTKPYVLSIVAAALLPALLACGPALFCDDRTAYRIFTDVQPQRALRRAAISSEPALQQPARPTVDEHLAVALSRNPDLKQSLVISHPEK